MNKQNLNPDNIHSTLQYSDVLLYICKYQVLFIGVLKKELC